MTDFEKSHNKLMELLEEVHEGYFDSDISKPEIIYQDEGLEIKLDREKLTLKIKHGEKEIKTTVRTMLKIQEALGPSKHILNPSL